MIPITLRDLSSVSKLFDAEDSAQDLVNDSSTPVADKGSFGDRMKAEKGENKDNILSYRQNKTKSKPDFGELK